MSGAELLWLSRGHWGIFIATYLFLGGLSGGAYLTSVASSELFHPRIEGAAERVACEETMRWGALLSVVAIGIGSVALLSHLGAPLRAFTFPVLFSNFGSWMVLGTWIIVLFSLVAALETLWLLFGTERSDTDTLSFLPRWILAWIDDRLPSDDNRGLVAFLDWIADLTRPADRLHRVVHGIGSVLAVGVIIYTAMLLTDVSTVPLWSRQYLPFIFLMSGASTGISAALLGTVASGSALSRTNHLFCLIDDGLILVETALLGGLLVFLSAGSVAAQESYAGLLSGSFGLLFVGGVLAFGLIVPFGMSMTMTGVARFTKFEETSIGTYVITGGFTMKYLLVLLGGFFLRYVVLFAAVKNPLGVP
jgi:protein NrfD